MAGYFDGKKISKVYLGTTVIYKEKVAEEPMFIIDSSFVPSARENVIITVSKPNGSVKRATVGDPFYKGDTLRVITPEWTLKFDGAPTYRPKGSSTRIPFETKVSNQEYATTFPQGYDGGLYFSTTKA